MRAKCIMFCHFLSLQDRLAGADLLHSELQRYKGMKSQAVIAQTHHRGANTNMKTLSHGAE